MTETRLKELQTEIARLEKIDNAITEQVDAELDNSDELGSAMAWTQEDDCQRPNEDCKHESLMDCDCDTMGSFDESGDAMEFTSAWTQEDVNDNLVIECSLQQDMEWANESENIQ